MYPHSCTYQFDIDFGIPFFTQRHCDLPLEMAEPLPSASIAAADTAADNEEDPLSRLPKNAEDRKAAAALNSLNTNEITQDESGGSAAKQPSKADQEALGKAMSRLEIATGTGAAKKKEEGKKAEEKTEGEVKKKVKVAAEDVRFLVCDLRLRTLRLFELLIDTPAG